MAHVFISYVHENQEAIDRLYADLTRHGVSIWLDKSNISPGENWRQAIGRAIREGAFFIACFSREYSARSTTYMNEELALAIEMLRQRPADRSWFIPVRLNECEIPDQDIRPGEALQDIQWVDLYNDWSDGIQSILDVTQPMLGSGEDLLRELDVAEVRILRGLVGEVWGRHLRSYKNDYYRPRIEKLLREGYIRYDKDKGYFLEQRGREFMKAYLAKVALSWE